MALVSGGETVSAPERKQLDTQLPLFLRDLPSIIGRAPRFLFFTLTDEAGRHVYVYALQFAEAASGAEGSALCLLSTLCCPTPFRSLLLQLSTAAATVGKRKEDELAAAMRTLSSLCAPTPRVPLCIGLADFRSCVFPAATPGHPPPADEHLCAVLHRLGMSNVLVLWHALLLERPVLLVSDAVSLLASACEALLLLLHPLRWECT